LDCSEIESTDIRNSFNNVTITQGDALFTPGCDQSFGDEVSIDCTDIVSDLSITQGVSDADLGSNIVLIATADDSTEPGVTVGDSTVINEVGANNGDNFIILGDSDVDSNGNPVSDLDFETGYLGIFAGLGGGSFVQVHDTQVDIGFLDVFGSGYAITGSQDSSNTIDIDAFSSANISVDPNAFN
jgi:hypothetical protein